MKKLIATITCLIATAGVLAQGTVNFTNETFDFSSPILGVDGSALPAGANYIVELWVGADAGSLAAVDGGTTTINIGGGIFDGGGVEVDSFAPGAAVVAAVRAWDNTTGSSWADAGVFGESDPFDITLGGAGNPPGLPTDMVNMESFQLVPEPSTVALGIIGAAALAFVGRRRK